MKSKKTGCLHLLLLSLTELAILCLAACSTANSKSDAACVVQRYLDAKKNNDFTCPGYLSHLP